MVIFVRTVTGYSVRIDANPTDTIASIKSKVYETEGVPEVHQRLIFAGKQLEDSKTLHDYKIMADSTLHLVLRLRGGMEIFVKLASGAQHYLQVSPGEAVNVARARLKEWYDTPSDGLKLHYAGSLIENEQLCWSDLNIRQGATLELMRDVSTSYHIVIKTIVGKRLELEVSPSDTPEQIKAMLQELEGWEAGLLTLVYKGRLIKTGTLGENGIASGDTVVLIIRLRAGG